MATKPTKRLKLRQKKLIQGVIEGKTQKQAAIDAGYPPLSAESLASQELKNPKVAEAFQALLDQICPDSRLVEKYGYLLDAKKVISANIIAPKGEGMKDADSMTKDFIEVDDCKVQLDTVNSITKLKGYMVEKVQHGADEALMAAVAARLSNAVDPRPED